MEEKTKSPVGFIITGDFNAILNHEDRFNPIKQKHNISKELINLMKEFDLEDSFKEKNPSGEGWTFLKINKESKNPQIFKNKARIDFFLTSKNIKVKECNFVKKNNIESDHRALYLEIEIEEIKINKIEPRNNERKININSFEDSVIQSICDEINHKNFPDLLDLSKAITSAIFQKKNTSFIMNRVNDYLLMLNESIISKFKMENEKIKKIYKNKIFVDNKEIRKWKTNNRKLRKILHLLDNHLQHPLDNFIKEKLLKKFEKLNLNLTLDNIDDSFDKIKQLRKQNNKLINNKIDKMRKSNITTNIKKRLKLHETSFKKFVKIIFPKQSIDVQAEYVDKKINNSNEIKRITNPVKVQEKIKNYWKNIFTSKTDQRNEIPSWLEKPIQISHQIPISEKITIKEMKTIIKK